MRGVTVWMKTIDVPVTDLTETMEALATPFKAAIPDDLFAGLASFMKPTEATLTQISDFAEVNSVASCIGNDAAKPLLTRRIPSFLLLCSFLVLLLIGLGSRSSHPGRQTLHETLGPGFQQRRQLRRLLQDRSFFFFAHFVHHLSYVGRCLADTLKITQNNQFVNYILKQN